MDETVRMGYCGVNCSVCPDFVRGKCPSCRKTPWTDDDVCFPVKCCLEKSIDLCGQCGGFLCGTMADFYEESDSHRQAEERMRKLARRSDGSTYFHLIRWSS